MDAPSPGAAPPADEALDIVGAPTPAEPDVPATPVNGAHPNRGAASTRVPRDPEGPPFSRITWVLLVAGAILAVAAGLLLRFWTRSDLPGRGPPWWLRRHGGGGRR